MAATGLEMFDTTLKKTNEWLKEIMKEMRWRDRHRAYLALRSVLHGLRDHLIVEEAVHLGAQLPLLVRGLYYEGYTPSRKRIRMRRREDLAARVSEAFQEDPEVDPEKVIRVVFGLLSRRVTSGEIEDIKGILPKEIREYWAEIEE